MPWIEPIFYELIMVIFIKCYFCFKIEGKKKVLVAKWDSIEKHTKGKLLMVCGLWI
jgi:hypothetical protein